MTIDLSKARVGSEVTTHAGAKLVIGRISDRVRETFLIHFQGYMYCWYYYEDGKLGRCGIHEMDIISITPPPLSDAELLVEIAKIAHREKERSIGAGVQCLVDEILSLLESRRP